MALAESVGILDWLLNGTQVGAKIMMLRKTWWAPIFGLIIQVFPVLYAIVNEQWGFLITPLVLIPIYGAHIKPWYSERYEHEFVVEHGEEYILEEHFKHPDWNSHIARKYLGLHGTDEEKEKYGEDSS
jgi:hypothetical protein